MVVYGETLISVLIVHHPRPQARRRSPRVDLLKAQLAAEQRLVVAGAHRIAWPKPRNSPPKPIGRQHQIVTALECVPDCLEFLASVLLVHWEQRLMIPVRSWIHPALGPGLGESFLPMFSCNARAIRYLRIHPPGGGDPRVLRAVHTVDKCQRPPHSPQQGQSNDNVAQEAQPDTPGVGFRQKRRLRRASRLGFGSQGILPAAPLSFLPRCFQPDGRNEARPEQHKQGNHGSHVAHELGQEQTG